VNEAYVELTFTSGTANPLWVFGDVASDDAASGDPAASQDAATIDNFSFSRPIRTCPMNGVISMKGSPTATWSWQMSHPSIWTPRSVQVIGGSQVFGPGIILCW
jgi:hypothetical protein